jgi:hypothetical protein
MQCNTKFSLTVPCLQTVSVTDRLDDLRRNRNDLNISELLELSQLAPRDVGNDEVEAKII